MKLALALLLLAPQDLKKGVLKAEDAGPDFKIQGEYKGAGWGAQVVALGDGKFDVWFLMGGLPGDGWNKADRVKAAATTADGKVTFASKDFNGSVDGQKLTAGDKVLERVERKSPTEGAKPPEGAVLPEFLAKGKDAPFVDGLLNTAGTGGFFSKAKYGNVKLHIEFMLSFMPAGRGQGRSNSGVYLSGRHECQVLDSFGLSGENNECGGIYTIAKPAVNMCFPPLKWQTYDIEYRLAADGKPATMSVLHNGVEIHKDVACGKKTTSSVDGGADSTPGPLHMQDHGNPVLYRNIWIVELK
ncbi:MAG TPA: DUF1080 domain-containing protein [Planctomycetota bacterium]